MFQADDRIRFTRQAWPLAIPIRSNQSETQPSSDLDCVWPEEDVSAWDGPKSSIGNVSRVENRRTGY